ncbi:MAG: RNA-directed DNA polymerase [Planctomycetota bacterium]
MKRCGFLFEEIASQANLWQAWLEFRRGKRGRPTVQQFACRALGRIAVLHRRLREGSYHPAPCRLFLLHEPKRRLIAAAEVADRVVHHAIHRVLAPRLDRRLVEHNYACLPERGAHRALLAFQRAMRRSRYVLLLDVQSYFPSIDPDILGALLRRWLKDGRVLALSDRILDAGRGLYDGPRTRTFLGLADDWPPAGRGLPIGNLTSQWWGNHYLSELDHRLRRVHRLPYAQRYMDDVALFADDPATLRRVRDEAAQWLADERHLRWKHPRREPTRTDQAVTYLGHRVSRVTIRPTDKAWARMRCKLGRALLHPDDERLRRSLAAY